MGIFPPQHPFKDGWHGFFSRTYNHLGWTVLGIFLITFIFILAAALGGNSILDSQNMQEEDASILIYGFMLMPIAYLLEMLWEYITKQRTHLYFLRHPIARVSFLMIVCNPPIVLAAEGLVSPLLAVILIVVLKLGMDLLGVFGKNYLKSNSQLTNRN